ncbi:hypothetical protein TanjilG_27225 [Lupinus angustifolius]|uniref:Uncharacterized protein n=1 Tax=Lupinus angustifolius TaxID=3871 RepID=A0A394D9H2_LUPAN|nr:PREDICTED: uncharacterized protein LOC109337421 [Lupinus angustifolius]OIW19859.1 hypothetical protein TanjilG_27225 [Lupinus angustifolius]
MSNSLLHLLGMFDDDDDDDEDDTMETQSRNYPNHGVVAPRRNATQPPNHGAVAPRRNATKPPAAFNNTGTQNLRGLINNTGYTKGNGNGSIIFGGFDSSTRTYNK